MSKVLNGQPEYIHSGSMIYDGCCDCGLVHFTMYRIRRVRGKQVIERISYRDDWETNLVRKNNKNK